MYRRGRDGRWVGTLELGWERGRRRRKSFVGKTRADVVGKLSTARRQLEDTGVVATNVPTIEGWLRRWLDEIARQRVAPKTLASHRSAVEQHLIPNLGKRRLDRLTPSHVLRLHQVLRETPTHRHKKETDGGEVELLGEATVLRVHAVLSRALSDAQRLGLVPRNVAQQVDRPGKGHAEIDELDAAQAATLLAHVAEDALGSRWAFALLTGQRQGECLGLRRSHLDLEQGLADVSWQLQRLDYRHGCKPQAEPEEKNWPCGRKYAGNCPQRQLDVRPSYEHTVLEGALCLTRPKGGKRKMVPLIPSLVAWLRRDLDRRPAGPHDLVWSRDGRPIDLRQDYQAWIDLLAACELPRVRLHSARHTCVSLLYSLGVTEPVIMQIVGHSVVSTTRGYKNQDTAAARAALRKLGQALQLEELPG